MKSLSILRSTRFTGAERKASIIEAATSLFAAKGFTGTKTREIAKRAGVSEALVFKHFPTKGDLYAAILAEQSPVPQLLAEIKELAAKREDEQVFMLIANTIVRRAPTPNLMRLLLFSALEEHKLSDMFFQNHVRMFYDFLAGYIEQRIREGAFRPVAPLLAARAFMGMLIYHRLLSQLFRVTVSNKPEEIVSTFVTVFLDGLRVNGSKRKSRVRKGRVASRLNRVSKK